MRTLNQKLTYCSVLAESIHPVTKLSLEVEPSIFSVVTDVVQASLHTIKW